MNLQFFGRKQLIDALCNGWGPVPGYDYAPGEYAFLLAADDARRTRHEARLLAGKLKGTKRPKMSNLSAASKCRKTHGGRLSRQKWADFRARLMSEVRA